MQKQNIEKLGSAPSTYPFAQFYCGKHLQLDLFLFHASLARSSFFFLHDDPLSLGIPSDPSVDGYTVLHILFGPPFSDFLVSLILSGELLSMDVANETSEKTTEGGHDVRRFTLSVEHELRFEIPVDGAADITLTLEHGSAELFGVELALNRPYPLPPGLNAAAFTWHGATLALAAPQSVMAYTATDTPMPSYIGAHAVLQSRRDLAKAAGIPGPRAIVVGPRDCGKSTLVSILSAYCVRANSSVVLADLDPSGCGAAGVVPGAVAISVVRHLDLETGGPVHDKVVSVMLGHSSPRHNTEVSEKAFETVGSVLDSIMSEREMDPSTGCVADTSGDIEGTKGISSVVSAVRALKADVVFVLGAERLYASINSELGNSATETILLGKSGGVVSRDEPSRMAMRARRIKHYFYGPENRLSPFSTVLDFSEVVILKVGGLAAVVPDSVLPVGAESTLDPLKPSTVTSINDTLHKILGISQANSPDNVLTSPVYGYVHVVKIDSDRNTMTVLAPSHGRIPSAYLLAGDTKWIE